MGNVHRLVLQHGIEEARGMVASKADRRAIDAAAAHSRRRRITPWDHLRRVRYDRVATQSHLRPCVAPGGTTPIISLKCLTSARSRGN